MSSAFKHPDDALRADPTPDEQPDTEAAGDPWERERELFEQAWEQIRDADDGSRRNRTQEIAHALDVLIDAFKSLLTTDAVRQWEDLIRRFLLALRQLIDAALERLDRDKQRAPVEDIPID